MQVKNRIISLPSGLNIDLVYVQGGIFSMGDDNPESPDREKPVHKVKLPDFFIGKIVGCEVLKWKDSYSFNPGVIQVVTNIFL